LALGVYRGCWSGSLGFAQSTCSHQLMFRSRSADKKPLKGFSKITQHGRKWANLVRSTLLGKDVCPGCCGYRRGWRLGQQPVSHPQAQGPGLVLSKTPTRESRPLGAQKGLWPGHHREVNTEKLVAPFPFNPRTVFASQLSLPSLDDSYASHTIRFKCPFLCSLS
jgi:hypothetical protein